MANDSDPFAGFEEAAPEQDEFSTFATASNDPEAGASFDDFAAQEVNPIELAQELDEDTLVEDLKFSPVMVAAQNQELVLNNPELANKLISIYDKKNKRGTTLGEKVSSAVEAAPEALKSAGRGIKEAVKRGTKLSPVGMAYRAIRNAFAEDETPKDLKAGVLKDITELGASVETAVTGSSDLLRRSGRALSKGDAKNTNDLRNRFFDDVAFFTQTEKSAAGEGAILDGRAVEELRKSGIEIDPQAVNDLSFVTDPVNFIPLGGSVIGLTGKGAKVLARTGKSIVGAERAARVAQALTKAASKTVKAGGKAVEAVGKATKAVGQGLGKVSGALGGAGAAGAISGQIGLPAAGAVMALPTLFKGAGGAISSVGRAMRGEASVLGKMARGTKGIIANPFVTGAAAGVADATLLSVPFLIGARADEEGAILGAAGALGAAGGAVAHTGPRAHNAIIGKLTERVKQEARESVPYGTDGNLDAAHAAQMNKLNPEDRNIVNAYREKMRDLFDRQGSDVEIYTVDRDTFAEQTGNQTAEGFFQVLEGTGNRDRNVVRILLNESPHALTHEAYHTFKQVLPEEQWRRFEGVVKESLTPRQLQEFSDFYNASLNQGLPKDQWTAQLTPDQVVEEVSAEAASQILQGRNIENIAPSVVDEGLGVVASLLETIGFDTSGVFAEAGPGVSDLGVRPSVRQANALTAAITGLEDTGAPTLQRVAEREAISQIEPGRVPTVSFSESQSRGQAPASTPPASPVGVHIQGSETPALNENARRAVNNMRGVSDLGHILDAVPGDEAGVARAQSFLDNDPTVTASQRDNGQAVLDNMGRAVVLETLSAKGDQPVRRRTRRKETEGTRQQELEGALPEDLRDLVQKSMIPYRVEIRTGTRGVDAGKPIFTILAASPDKIVNNASLLLKQAAEKNLLDRVPYETNRDGSFTELGLRAFLSDVKAYSENHAHGYAGDGSHITIPDNYEGFIPPEDRGYRSVSLPEDNANFINMTMGTPPPKTTKRPSGATAKRVNPITDAEITAPANVEAQRLAEASGKELLVSSISTDEKPFKDFATGIAEFNPLRNEFVDAGVDVRNLAEEFTERVRLDKIKSVAPAPDAPIQSAARPLLTQAGFKPARFPDVDARLKEVVDATDPAAFRALMDGQEGGLTGYAVNIGLALTDPKQLDFLSAQEAASSARGKELMKAGDFDAAMSQATKTQFFREAREAATGTGSMGRFLKDSQPDVRPPFSEDGGTPELLSKTLSVAGKGDSVASTLVQSLADNDGGTINTKTGELLNDKPVYMVSIYPERGVQYEGKNLTESNVDSFIETNGDLLSQDQNSLGVFYDDGTKTTDLDVVVATPDKDLAIALGKKFNQKSIWDAANKDTIETGGTGERVTIDIPEGERVRRTQEELKQGFRPDVDPNDTTLAFRKPRTEAGAKLVEDGFSFGMDDFGGGSTFELEFRDNGTIAGTLNASLIDGDTANVGSVFVSPQYRRKGIAEALYREFATELQKKGVTKLTGTTINKAPFDLRKKVFGDFENVELVARGTTPDNVRIERRADVDPAIARRLLPDPSEGFQAVSSMNIEPTSRVDPNVQFKPKKKPTFASKADQDNPPLTSKSWILPDGEFVPLKRWPEHEDFLMTETKDLQKLFKTPKNLKGDKAAAVAKHGFTRMTYERNSGRLNIESSVKAWNKKELRDQIFSYVADHLDSVDNMSVTLFDEKGRIAKQDSSQLFLIDDDAAKLDALPLITQTRSTRGAFKPSAPEERRDNILGYLSYKGLDFATEASPILPSQYILHENPSGMVTAAAYGKPFENAKPQLLHARIFEDIETAKASHQPAGLHTGPEDIKAAQEFFDTYNKTSAADVAIEGLDAPAGATGLERARKIINEEPPIKITEEPNLPKITSEEDLSSAWVTRNGQGYEVFNASDLQYHDDAISLFSQFEALDTGESNIPAFQSDTGAMRISIPDSEAHINDYGGQIGISISRKPTGAQLAYLNRLIDSRLSLREGYTDVSVDVTDRDGNVLAYKRASLSTPIGVRKLMSFMRDPLKDVNPSAFKPRAQELDLGPLDSVAAPSKKLAKEIRFPEALPVTYQKHKNGRVKMDSKRNPIPVLQDYDLENTALGRQIKENGGTREDVVNATADQIKDLFEEHKDVPELADGLTWYEETRDLLSDKLGDDWDLMAQLLAGTSPGTGVDINFAFAVEAFNMFKQGKFDAKIKKYLEGVEKLKSGELMADWKATSKTSKEPSDAALLGKWIDTHNLKPQKSNGKLFGFHGPRLLQIFANRWKENNQGPKVQQFYENLTGKTFGATIDIWMARQLHRLGNEGVADGPWRLLPEVETGVSEKDFKFGQDVLGKAADELGIKPDAMQAFLWFLEKDVWGKRGWTKEVGKAKSSFAELLKKIERKGDELVPIESVAPQGTLDLAGLEIESR